MTFCFVLKVFLLWSVSETSFLVLTQQMTRGQQNHVNISLGQIYSEREITWKGKQGFPNVLPADSPHSPPRVLGTLISSVVP